MHFLFPSDPMMRKTPDDFFSEQATALSSAGFTWSLCPEEVLTESRSLKGIAPGSSVVYRGWMLNSRDYCSLVDAIGAEGATAFISKQEYLATHHLPNWYPLISDLTPETRVFSAEADLVNELKALGWEAFFVKDYVKSLKTSVGSLIRDACQIETVVAEMEAYRGEIEGGVCVRQVEDFIGHTERRYFVVNGQPYSPSELVDIPEIVKICAARIPSKFFSVDAVERRDGITRIVEIGDGQVSDLVGWTPEAFARIWQNINQ